MINKMMIEKDVKKYKKYLNQLYRNQELDKFLGTVRSYCNYIYEMNQIYTDHDVEKMLHSVVQGQLKVQEFTPDTNKVIFFDGFGIDARGLVDIYLDALIKNGYELYYVTNVTSKAKIPNILRTVNEYEKGHVYLYENTSYSSQIRSISEYISKNQIGKMILYTTPFDVTGVSVAMSCENIVDRFLVNLTDHAFWLGATAVDYILEFRSYGITISINDRGISKDKLINLPYYPIINKDIEFAGFPFDLKDKKLIFSGGALYKTLGGNNQYYKVVRTILEKHEDVIFLYAGSGDTTEMDKIIADFKDRAFLISERRDLYQVIKRATIYLNTYPIVGGLMTQYAVASGTIPVTLFHDECASGFILDSDELGNEFHDVDHMLHFIDEFLDNEELREEIDHKLAGQLITPDQFVKELEMALEEKRTDYSLQTMELDTDEFLKTYLERQNIQKYCRIFSSDISKPVWSRFPMKTAYGLCLRLLSSMKNK